jgi:hypothetical protein
MAPALALELAGLANNAPVEVVGTGEVDAGRLRLEVRTLRANLAFDPALVAVGILDVLAVVGTAHVRSRTDLYDEHGREAGGWRVIAATSRDASTVRPAGLLLDHRTHMEPGEQVRSVGPWTTLAQPLEPEGVLLAGAWHAQTGRGNGYRGVSVAVVERDLLESLARLEFGPVRVRRETEGSGERLAIEAAVNVTALAEATA